MNINCSYTKIEDIELLTPNPRNPNTHNKQQIEVLAKILQHQGWRAPIIVSKQSGHIVTGHGRLEAARLNNWQKVPVDYQDFANEADEYAHLVADNKIAELSAIDLSMINNDLPEIADIDFDVELLGIPGFKIDPSEIRPPDEKPKYNFTIRCENPDQLKRIREYLAAEKNNASFYDFEPLMR